jgi:hypothetical protein
VSSAHKLFFCVTVSGDGFDAFAFARAEGAPLGEVLTRKHSGPPLLDNHPPTYWASVDHPSARDTLGTDIEMVLSAVKRTDPDAWHGKVSVQIVDNSTSNEDRGGYYLPASLIKLLAEMDADIDIDVAYGELT